MSSPRPIVALLVILVALPAAGAAGKGFAAARGRMAEGLRSSDPDRRSQAVYELDGFDDEDAAETLVRYVLTRDDRAQVYRAAIQLLGAMRSPEALAALSAEATRGPWRKRALVLEALGKWRTEEAADPILLAAYDEDPRVRISAILAAEGLPGGRADVAVADSLRAKEWPVRSAAAFVLQQRKAESAVPVLIERLGAKDEAARIVDQVRAALVRISGEDFGFSPSRWLAWWRAKKGEEAPDPVIDSGVRVEPRATMKGVETRARRIVYVLALGDSMNNEVRADGAKAAPEDVRKDGGAELAAWAEAKTKLDFAKLWIAWSIRNLADDVEFDVVTYGSSANAVFSGFERATPETRECAIRRIAGLSASGNANLYDGIRQVFTLSSRDPTGLDALEAGPEEVFFVSDGTADTGEIREGYRIFEEAERWNRFRQIRFDSFGVGAYDSRVLADLAGMIPGGTVRSLP